MDCATLFRRSATCYHFMKMARLRHLTKWYEIAPPRFTWRIRWSASIGVKHGSTAKKYRPLISVSNALSEAVNDCAKVLFWPRAMSANRALMMDDENWLTSGPKSMPGTRVDMSCDAIALIPKDWIRELFAPRLRSCIREFILLNTTSADESVEFGWSDRIQRAIALQSLYRQTMKTFKSINKSVGSTSVNTSVNCQNNCQCTDQKWNRNKQSM